QLVDTWLANPDPALGRQLVEALSDLGDDGADQRFFLGPLIDRLACAGLPEAEALLFSWHPALSDWVGRSDGARRVRAGLLRWSRTKDDLLLVGEQGAGHHAAANTLHVLGFGAPSWSPSWTVLWESMPEIVLERELADLPRGGFLYVEDACPGERFGRVAEAARRTRSRLIVGCTPERSRGAWGHRFGAALELPPLRERREDLPLLIQRRLAQHGLLGGLGEQDLALLAGHGWPGNLNELDGLIELVVEPAPLTICERFRRSCEAWLEA
ncbi:MAG TPA: hypothetical protein DEA08_29400, partial [Planctomycetes bacterium]|nr:hypothetical protein [Planctomycetota bacterium]